MVGCSLSLGLRHGSRRHLIARGQDNFFPFPKEIQIFTFFLSSIDLQAFLEADQVSCPCLTSLMTLFLTG